MPITDNDIYNCGGILKYMDNTNPICPECDAVIDIKSSGLFYLYSEGIHAIKCPFCARDINVISIVTLRFNTEINTSRDGSL